MIFQHTWQKILTGEKTQTCRLWKKGDKVFWAGEEIEATPRKMLDKVSRHDRTLYETWRSYAVQPGRGHKSVARIEIIKIRLENVYEMSEAQYAAEGLRRDEFIALWRKMHGEEFLAYALTFEITTNAPLKRWVKSTLSMWVKEDEA